MVVFFLSIVNIFFVRPIARFHPQNGGKESKEATSKTIDRGRKNDDY
jgi:hypothetical protein